MANVPSMIRSRARMMLMLLGAAAAGCDSRRTAGPPPEARLSLPSSSEASSSMPRPEPGALLDSSAKIEFDLALLDDAGLRGPPDGKVALDYEFAIPDTDAAREEVRRIDPTVRFIPGSRGRVGARPGECLCIGSTHQPDFRGVLAALARLPTVARIIECHHE